MKLVGYTYLSYCDDNPPFGRWDQEWVGRMLNGSDAGSSLDVQFVERSTREVFDRGGVIVFPAGHYHEHGEKHVVLKKLWDDLVAMPWGVLIATSDECATFEWHKIDPWPSHIVLWCMTPRPEKLYPATQVRFIGEGSPTAGCFEGDIVRDVEVFLSCQTGHERRDECLAALQNSHPAWDVHPTEGFTLGLSQHEYLERMRRTVIAPAPSGPCTQDSFRLFEALENGAIPIADGLRPGGVGAGYWDMIGMGWLPVVNDWSEAPALIGSLLDHRHFNAALISSRWQQYKRERVRELKTDVAEAAGFKIGVSSDVTVLVPTSPIPSHPDMSILLETVGSVQERLPDAEIFVLCDGIRFEQDDRWETYSDYLVRVTAWCAGQPNVTPVVFERHMHQSGMMRAILPSVDTEFVLYMEHDCPLVGDINFGDVVTEMRRSNLNMMRFMHETGVLPGHEHLFLNWEKGGPAWWRATIQWSQRPHVARTSWYDDIIDTYFGNESKTFIEDVMHGVVQHGTYNNKRNAYAAWRKWRMAVYAPDGNMKRSTHLDGRDSDPKFPMFISYDNGRPEGAPPEGFIS